MGGAPSYHRISLDRLQGQPKPISVRMSVFLSSRSATSTSVGRDLAVQESQLPTTVAVKAQFSVLVAMLGLSCHHGTKPWKPRFFKGAA